MNTFVKVLEVMLGKLRISRTLTAPSLAGTLLSFLILLLKKKKKDRKEKLFMILKKKKKDLGCCP